MENLPEGIDSKFRYVLLVAKRAEQLIQGAVPRSRTRYGKPTRTAMDEINNKLVRWQIGSPIEPSLDNLGSEEE